LSRTFRGWTKWPLVSTRQKCGRSHESGNAQFCQSINKSVRTYTSRHLEEESGCREEDASMSTVPQWHLAGDWFDVCKCNIPCPCTFAQAPSEGDCEGILAWHIREGSYGDVRLDGLNVLALGTFEGNIWAGETKATMGIYMDERADDRQRESLQMVFAGKAGGWPGEFANVIGEVRGIEY